MMAGCGGGSSVDKAGPATTLSQPSTSSVSTTSTVVSTVAVAECAPAPLLAASDASRPPLVDRQFYVYSFACADDLALAKLSYRVDNPNGHASEALFRDDGGRWVQLVRSGPELIPPDLEGTGVSSSTLQMLRARLQRTDAPTGMPSSGGVEVLFISAEDRAALRTTFLAKFQGRAPAADEIEGPLPGSVYYALDNSTGTYWALATFSVPPLGSQDQPEVFSKKPGEAWVDLGDSGGSPCQVPLAVRSAWNYRPLSC